MREQAEEDRQQGDGHWTSDQGRAIVLPVQVVRGDDNLIGPSAKKAC
jgi:hypothetical protein